MNTKIEHYETSKLLNHSSVSKFVTKKWIDVNNLLGGQYSVYKNIRFKTSMLRSDLCDYNDAYNVVKERISVKRNNNAKIRNKKLIFKNNAQLRVNNKFIDNAKDFDTVMPMYSLLECSSNYFMTSESLWNYYKDEVNDDANENNAANSKINNKKTITSKSFKCKTKITGRIPDDNNTFDTEVIVPLKCLSKFLRFLDLPLINCEIIEITEILITPIVVVNPDANPPLLAAAVIQTTGATFQTISAKFYV